MAAHCLAVPGSAPRCSARNMSGCCIAPIRRSSVGCPNCLNPATTRYAPLPSLADPSPKTLPAPITSRGGCLHHIAHYVDLSIAH
jgi:hypothetical protein